MQRRSFLGLILAGTVAPSIVRASSLMKVKPILDVPRIWYAPAGLMRHRGNFWALTHVNEDDTAAKFRALGINEEILDGKVKFSTARIGNGDRIAKEIGELRADYGKLEEQASRALDAILLGRVGARGSIDPKTGFVTFDSFNLVR